MRNIHVPYPTILVMAGKQKKPKEEFLDETTEKEGESVEYLDDEFEEDELETDE